MPDLFPHDWFSLVNTDARRKDGDGDGDGCEGLGFRVTKCLQSSCFMSWVRAVRYTRIGVRCIGRSNSRPQHHLMTVLVGGRNLSVHPHGLMNPTSNRDRFFSEYVVIR